MDEEKPLDYSNFFEGKNNNSGELKGSPGQNVEAKGEKGKRGFLYYWRKLEKKEKIEIIIMAISLLAAVFFLFFHFLGASNKKIEPPPFAPPPGEEEMFGN